MLYTWKGIEFLQCTSDAGKHTPEIRYSLCCDAGLPVMLYLTIDADQVLCMHATNLCLCTLKPAIYELVAQMTCLVMQHN